jgi:hypothetical protein
MALSPGKIGNQRRALAFLVALGVIDCVRIQVAGRAKLGRLIEGGLNNVAVCDQPMCATRS